MRIITLLLLVLVLSCNNNKHHDGPSNDVNTDVLNENEYNDGTWCAEVEYYNPNTGTRNTYDLNVEVENGELVEIHWPNGGWLDESHFSAEDITDGECSFISDRGYHYAVTLNEKGGCSF